MTLNSRKVWLGLLILGLLGQASTARLGVIVNQDPGIGVGIVSQDMPDFPTFSSAAFDDFTLTQAHVITTFTAYGFDQNAAPNVAVVAGIYATPDLTTAPLYSETGSEDDSGNLTFDFGGALLDVGTYWITAYIVRPFDPRESEWFWRFFDPVSGSYAMWHNPFGGWDLGTAPTSAGPAASVGLVDMAYTLSGVAVPEPSPLALGGTLTVVGFLASRARRRLARATVRT
jgi:hypothetical protein